MNADNSAIVSSEADSRVLSTRLGQILRSAAVPGRSDIRTPTVSEPFTRAWISPVAAPGDGRTPGTLRLGGPTLAVALALRLHVERLATVKPAHPVHA